VHQAEVRVTRAYALTGCPQCVAECWPQTPSFFRRVSLETATIAIACNSWAWRRADLQSDVSLLTIHELGPQVMFIVPESALSASREELGEFFLMFSRFEFSVKAAGYAKQGRWGEAKPDWDAFAVAIVDELKEQGSEDYERGAEYLSSQPPKVQTYENGALGWSAEHLNGSWSAERILLARVLGVRNNLMHGAKFLAAESQDVDRDRHLMVAATCVIERFVDASSHLREAFFSPAAA